MSFMGRGLFLALFAASSLLTLPQARAADDVRTLAVSGSDFPALHDAVIESIEAEGLVVGAVLPIQAMLARTGEAFGQSAPPVLDAEVIQFCSSRLAWLLAGEAAEQLALCPLSLLIYRPVAPADTVMLAWRTPGETTPGRIAAGELFHRLATRAAQLGRWRW